MSLTFQPQIPYPKTTFVIVGHQLATYFVFTTFRIVLVDYVTSNLGCSEADATIIYNIYLFLAHTLTITSALLTDSWLGKYTTISFLSLLVVIGSVLVALSAYYHLNYPLTVVGFVGFSLVALGICGILPIGLAFGGEQFILPRQQEQLLDFFSIAYFWISLSALFATFLVPLMLDAARWSASVCFAALMFVATALFMAFYKIYRLTRKKSNLFKSIPITIYHGIYYWRKERRDIPRPHWLDYADRGDYHRGDDNENVHNTKALLNIILLFLPLSMFWAVKEYQGYGWTLQAKLMDDSFGSIDIKPNQMEITNPLMLLILIPAFNLFIYKLLYFLGIRRSLQKMGLGGCLAVLSLLCSSALHGWVESYAPVELSTGKSQLRIINGENCSYVLTTNLPGTHTFIVPPVDMYVNTEIPTTNGTFTLNYTISGSNCPKHDGGTQVLREATASTLFLGSKSSVPTYWYKDYVEKPAKARTLVRTLVNLEADKQVKYETLKRREPVLLKELEDRELYDIPKGYYVVLVDDTVISAIYIGRNGVLAVIVNEKGAKIIEVVHANAIHMLWQLPQYFLISAAEVLLCITGLEYSFTEAPISMKSLFLALWFGPNGLGNVVVALVMYFNLVKLQSLIYLIFASALFLSVGLFIFLAVMYNPNNSLNREVQVE